MSENTKPHKGQIDNWWKWPATEKGLGYMIVGTPIGHPEFSSGIRTSYVAAHDENTGEIETRNSRYTLLTPMAKP